MMKLTRTLLTVAALLIAVSSHARKVEIDNIFYELNTSDMTASVTYKGRHLPEPAYSGSIEIPAQITADGKAYAVTGIGESAFENCTGLTSVSIPSSVTNIGRFAFQNCFRLESVTVPSSVTSIGEGAFWSCISLLSIDVEPDNATYCSEDGVLYDKDKTVLHAYPEGKAGLFTVPSSVTSIGFGAFFGCEALTSVTLPDGLTSIANNGFYGCI